MNGQERNSGGRLSSGIRMGESLALPNHPILKVAYFEDKFPRCIVLLGEFRCLCFEQMGVQVSGARR